MKRILSVLIIAVFALTGAIFVSAEENTGKSTDIVILFTNDVHCGIDDNIGYAGVAAYKAEMQSIYEHVALVDAGDYAQGGVLGTLSRGEYIIDIMNFIGYDAATIGNHEFDYSIEQLHSLADRMEFPLVSCNFISFDTGEPVFAEYTIAEYGDTKIAFVGITTPESYTKSTPKYFKNDDGDYIYGFCGDYLAEQIQSSVDAARDEGADYIIALAHLGVDPSSSPWTSQEIFAEVSGVDAVIDGHSHTIMNETVTDADGNEIILAQTGTKLSTFGKLIITEDGEITSELIESYDERDEAASKYIAGINSEFAELLNSVVAETEFDLIVNDPETGRRLIRSSETNLGDLCADAYRIMLGADIGIVNGGGIRADIKTGQITYGDIISVQPFGNMACVIEATGQEILDALEIAYRSVGTEEEQGAFLQVSGLYFDIHTYIEPTVVFDEYGAFVSVDGEYRVKNVMILNSDTGEYEPLQSDGVYTIGSYDYLLKNGGISIFTDNTVITDEVAIDNQMLIDYIVEALGGTVGGDYSNPYGQGRINVVSEMPSPEKIVIDMSIFEYIRYLISGIFALFILLP